MHVRSQGMAFRAEIHPAGHLLVHQHEFGQTCSSEIKSSLRSHLDVLKGEEQNNLVAEIEAEKEPLAQDAAPSPHLTAPHPGVRELLSAFQAAALPSDVSEDANSPDQIYSFELSDRIFKAQVRAAR